MVFTDITSAEDLPSYGKGWGEMLGYELRIAQFGNFGKLVGKSRYLTEVQN